MVGKYNNIKFSKETGDIYMFFYTEYKHSILATIMSLCGGGFLAAGVVCFFDDTPEAGFIFIPLGGLLMYIASNIAKKKLFKKWLEDSKQKMDIDSFIQASVDNAVLIYKKCPGKYMLRYIENLNPAAGQHIKNLIEQKQLPKK